MENILYFLICFVWMKLSLSIQCKCILLILSWTSNSLPCLPTNGGTGICFHLLLNLLEHHLTSQGPIQFLPPYTRVEQNIWRELELNPGSLATQATAPTAWPWLPGRAFFFFSCSSRPTEAIYFSFYSYQTKIYKNIWWCLIFFKVRRLLISSDERFETR